MCTFIRSSSHTSMGLMANSPDNNHSQRKNLAFSGVSIIGLSLSSGNYTLFATYAPISPVPIKSMYCDEKFVVKRPSPPQNVLASPVDLDMHAVLAFWSAYQVTTLVKCTPRKVMMTDQWLGSQRRPISSFSVDCFFFRVVGHDPIDIVCIYFP